MPGTNWDEEFEVAIEKLRKAWRENKLIDFLRVHSTFHIIISNKIQGILDDLDNDPVKKEIHLGFDEKGLNKLDSLNANLERLFSSMENNPTGETNEKTTQATGGVRPDPKP